MKFFILASMLAVTASAKAENMQDLIVELITVTARSEGVDPALAVAIAEQESSLVPNKERFEKRYNTYSVGLFQMFIPTAKDMGFKGSKEELKTPTTNIKLGIAHLKSCTSRFGSDARLVACCHNAGKYVKVKFCSSYAWTARYAAEVVAKKAEWDRKLSGKPEVLAVAE